MARALRWVGEERRVQRGWGQGQSLRGPPPAPSLLQQPQKEPLMSVCPEEPREQGGVLSHLRFSSPGCSPGGSANKAFEDT